VSTIDPQAFRDFEHRGWQEIASRYHEGFASITTQSITPLLDAANAVGGTRVLDVACGPGYATAAAAARGAFATGIDFSSEMVQEAQGRYPGLDFREDDAENLRFDDTSFDAVVSNFGMLHLSSPEAAIRQAHRVLRAGGRFAFTVWDVPEKCLGFSIVLNAIEKHGNPNVPLPPGPPFFRFSDPVESERVLKAAGFNDVRVIQVPQIWRLSAPDALFDVLYRGSVRNAALLRAQTPDALEKIRAEMRAKVEHARNELPMPSVLASAAK